MSATMTYDPMYDLAPRIVIWEMTRACALACRHCRAEAIPRRNPQELTTPEAFALVDDVVACGKPLFVLTGGDPLMRDDVYKIAEYAASRGLPVSISPSATRRLTPEAIRRLSAAGVRRIALSLDAPDAPTHDEFRGVPGSFERTLHAIGVALTFGISVQINTTLSQMNRQRIDDFEALLSRFDIALWSVFFVLPVGRADRELCLDAAETERAFAHLARVAKRAPFDVKTTEAPHYRRYLLQHADRAPREAPTSRSGVPTLRFAGIGDGRGFIFVSHRGEVQPSGFFPLTVGNVREKKLIDMYRDDSTLQRLRRPDTFDGKCGVCEFRRICGGSRARAYATSGNAFGSDPSCAYIPAGGSAVGV